MGEIHASLIIEILGRPKENVKEAIQTIATRLGAEKGVKVIKKELHEPAPVKDSKDLFTTFAEIEVELESLGNYFGILFAYMPSHIEIIKPEKFSLMNSELNELGNNLVQRLHNYDAITKKAVVESQTLAKKLQEVAPHLFEKAQSGKVKEEKPKAKRKTAKKKKK